MGIVCRNIVQQARMRLPNFKNVGQKANRMVILFLQAMWMGIFRKRGLKRGVFMEVHGTLRRACSVRIIAVI